MSRSPNRSHALWLALALAAATGAIWWLSGCASVAKIATQTAAATGHISQDEANSLNRSIDAVDLTFQGISPEQEYYIGRAVAARMLTTYDALENAAANRYLNQLGQTLAMASDRPETFAGYHFLLFDSEEINAFAAPSGFILVSTGLANLCRSEDELAAVLAHEIGHVVGKHGLRAIKNSRLTSALTILATESARHFGNQEMKELVTNYEGTIDDIAGTLLVNGYSRGLEAEADRMAVTILERVGYDPKALTRMLGEMQKRLQPGGLDFARTHPAPQDRIDAVAPVLADLPDLSGPQVRHDRFQAIMRSGL